MPATGDFTGNFTGCLFLCSAGYYGASDDHQQAECDGPCWRGHYCEAGTAMCTAARFEPRNVDCLAHMHLLVGQRVSSGRSVRRPVPCGPGTFSDALGGSSTTSCSPW
eukprot:2437662-Prymnesium_polylepis.2